MRNKAIVPTYLLLVFVLLIGSLFKIQHYPGGTYLLLSGFVIEIIFVVLLSKEIYSSTKATKKSKKIWIVLYCLAVPATVFVFTTFSVLFSCLLCPIMGLIYLIFVRKMFAPKERVIDKIKFDSF